MFCDCFGFSQLQIVLELVHPTPNDEPNQIPVTDFSLKRTFKNEVFFSRCIFPKMFPNVMVPEANGLYAPGLCLLGSPRLASASLALPAPATTAAALRAARPPKAAGLLLRGAGKASEADARRGKPSKARPGETAGPGLALTLALYLGVGPDWLWLWL